MSVTALQRAELLAAMDPAETLAQELLAAQKTGKFRIEQTSPAAKQLFAVLRRKNLAGLSIHQEAGHGWFADLLFKDLPPHLSNCIGTPNHQPLPSEAEARQAGIRLLAIALFTIMRREDPASVPTEPETDPDTCNFGFFGCWLSLPRKAVALTQAAASAWVSDGGSYDFSEPAVRQRLDQIKQTCFGPGEVTRAGLKALSSDHQEAITALCAIAVSIGLVRHPPTSAFESITCPQCRRTSYNETDIKTRYCGACHQFHDEMA